MCQRDDSDCSAPQETLWKEATPESIMDSKLKCVFDFPAANSSANSTVPSGRAMNDDFSSATTFGSDTIHTDKLHGSPTGKVKVIVNFRLLFRPLGCTPRAYIMFLTVAITFLKLDRRREQNEVSSPITSSSDARKIQDENRRLRDELTHIRQENMQLKEEGLRQRVKHGQSGTTTSADLLAQQKMIGGSQDLATLFLNPNVLALGVVVFIAGLLAGKVIF